jgi:hypothetical protein
MGAASGDKPLTPAATNAVAGVDRAEFRQALDKGGACAQGRDFACAEAALATAQKLALTHQERRELIAKWQLLDGEKRQVELASVRKEAERVAQPPAVANANTAGASGSAARATIAAPANTAVVEAPRKKAVSCLDALQGTWSHDVGGEWTFSGSTGTLVLRSTNQGGTARQTTVMEISSCDGGTLRYRLVRAAMESAYGSYDKTEDNDQPPTVNWSKVYNQAYSLSGDSLRLGNYTYER